MVQQYTTPHHTHDLRVAAALERLATDARTLAEQAAQRVARYKAAARRAWGIGDFELAAEWGHQSDIETAERAFFRRGATAYTNALAYWQRGIRPEQLPSGAYILPSVGSGQGAHLITRSGDWCCCCDAGSQMHWPIALLIGMEIAGDDLDTTDAAPLPFEPTPAEERQARRAQVEAAVSEWF